MRNEGAGPRFELSFFDANGVIETNPRIAHSALAKYSR